MRSIDTNVIARYVMQDDPRQTPIATRIIAEPCFVSDTVLLETAWLLSSRYRMARAILAATLQDIVRLPSVTVSSRTLIDWAIERFAAGADFADMMHIVAARTTDSFASFEHRLGGLAGPDTSIPVEALD